MLDDRRNRYRLLSVGALALGGCVADPSSPGSTGRSAVDDFTCSIPVNQIVSGGPGKDGIPALTNPVLVGAHEPGASYVRDGDRVVGIDLDGQKIAVPLNIGWWHEIVNFELDTLSVAVTHCPLTGSSLAFDRTPLAGVEFGVSGLLYRNNLIMYDRSSGESLWPQMGREAVCGPGAARPSPCTPLWR